MVHTQEVQDTAGVAPLVVIPCNELDEVLVEGNAGGSIEDAGVIVSIQVSGDKRILRVGHDAYLWLAETQVSFYLFSTYPSALPPKPSSSSP